LEVKVSTSGRDEIADLGSSFNIMLGKIKALLDQSIREQKQIRKAELRALQAQINPHFLYNTLDSIVWMAEAGKNSQVIQLVQALSRFFRISLNKGRDWITLRDELEHVRSYLIIQQM
ncbi:sensor histidine kinase, partial [Paenibacillus sp. MCAF20]